MRDDAERAAIVAALGNLQVRVVPGREAQALCRHEVHERVMHRRHRGMHRLHHLLVLMRAGDGEHAGMALADAGLLDAEAAGDDHLAVLGHGLADGVEALLLGAVEEAAGVHHHDVGAGIVGRYPVALGPQLGQDALGIDQRLGAAEGHKAHGRHMAALFLGRRIVFQERSCHGGALARAVAAGEPQQSSKNSRRQSPRR